MPCRGVRGATTTETNTREDILRATRELLALMARQNGIRPEDVASVVFSTTEDLDAEFPAQAARQLGWMDAAMMCVNELDVPGSLRRCIRVLLNWNTDKPNNDIIHVYLKGAAILRPDLVQVPSVDWDELEQWISQLPVTQRRYLCVHCWKPQIGCRCKLDAPEPLSIACPIIFMHAPLRGPFPE